MTNEKKNVEQTSSIDFDARPINYVVMQWDPVRELHVGTKGSFDNRVDAENMVEKLSENFTDRVYGIVEKTV